MSALDRFSPATRTWFTETFARPTPAQERGWPAITEGAHTLIHAPTGSGKTLAAFLWTLDRLFHQPTPEPAERCRVLYVSPLKALAYDVDRNLRAPLAGIRHAAARRGIELPEIDTALRTGDTPSAERRRMLRRPPDVLITTPESLYLLLTSRAREILRPVRWVIVDEVHAVAGSKRGAHLALSLERLQELTGGSPQRIGLSATQRPLDEIARFLGGGTPAGDGWEARPVRVVDVPSDKELDVEIVVPVEDMAALGEEEEEPRSGPAAQAPPRRSIWPHVYPRVLELVRAHRSTIVFANSRRLAERLCAELNRLAGEELARAHHGSVAREQRVEIEEALKRGSLRAVVATSSLELGIDMGAVDLVVQVESPTTVARGLQRVGRAGHKVGVPSRAKLFPKYRGDLLEATVVVDRMYAGAIEETRIPRNPLDVLAQQVVAMVAMEPRPVAELFEMVRRAAPYAELTRGAFEGTLDMLAGRYPSDEFAELRPRLVWDRVEGILAPRGNAQLLAVTNPGTIPDRGLYGVFLPDGARVGELDEEMVYESRPGDVFVLGASVWRIADIEPDRVVVVPAPGEPGAKMPFWHGDALGRPLETGRALGAFIREVAAEDVERATELLRDRYRLDPLAAGNLAAYLAEERAATGALPDDRTVVVERFRDEIGDWRVVLLAPFGSRVHAPWAMAVRRRLEGALGHHVDVVWTDDGMAFRFPDADRLPGVEDLLLDPEELEEEVTEALGATGLFAARFREAAARALLLPRRRPGRRTPLWLQRRRAADLLAVSRRYGSFPILLETYREVLQDDFDLPGLRHLLGEIRSRRIRVHEVELPSPSPFASSLLFDFAASYLYEGDAPLAERRAAALTLDRELLRELLGEAELRDLLDPEVVEQVELELQALTEDRRATGPDGLHDLLRRLGPLTAPQAQARARIEDVPSILEDLAAQRRLIRVRMGGEERWAATEDAARLRDALGVALPPGIPDSLLEPVPDPVGDVVGRYARTRGPFTPDRAATDLGLPVGVVQATLDRLAEEGRVVAGAFRPGGTDREWVDADVLRRLRRRSLAVLRGEIEPVEQPALARFLAGWQGVEGQGSSGRMLEVVRQLQGAELPASILERDVLATRLDYSPDLLDALTLAGEVVWMGRGTLGSRDGRVALYLRDQLPLLHTPVSVDPPEGPIHDRLRAHLGERGASFFRDLYQAVGGGDPQEVLEALWDLVWSGEVTNDSLAPLRAFLLGRARRVGRGGGPRLPSAVPPAGAGRWSSTTSLRTSDPPATEVAAAHAQQLLERHGVVTRSAVLAEGVPGGFSGLYPVLAAMEEAGRLRRGYFVEGLGGAQFALPGAVDRLRIPAGETGSVLLAAADPANPYGAALDWPEHPAGQAGRSAGAYVVTVEGRLAVFLERGGRTALVFEDDQDRLASAAARLAELADGRYRSRLTLQTIDGRPAAESALGDILQEMGFVPSYKGLAYRGRP